MNPDEKCDVLRDRADELGDRVTSLENHADRLEYRLDGTRIAFRLLAIATILLVFRGWLDHANTDARLNRLERPPTPPAPPPAPPAPAPAAA